MSKNLLGTLAGRGRKMVGTRNVMTPPGIKEEKEVGENSRKNLTS